MRALQSIKGLLVLHQRRGEVLRLLQTASQKQTQAATLLEADMRTEWNMAKPLTAMPGPKPLPIPYVGNMWRFLPMFNNWGEDLAKMHKSMYDEYGPIVRLTGIGKKDMVLLFDAEDVEKLFRNESIWPEKKLLQSLWIYRNVVRKDFYGEVDGLVTSEGEKWQTFRTTTNQAMMQPKKAMMYLDSVSAVADDFIDRVRRIRQPNEEMPPNFMEELNKLGLETFGVITLDMRLGCLNKDLSPDSEPKKMIQGAQNIVRLIYELDFTSSLWKYISTPAWREFVRTSDELLEIVVKLTNAKWEEFKNKKPKDGEDRSILEALLLKAENPKIAIVTTMDTLIAGIDTTSNNMATVMYYLATNPEKQEKLFQELKEFLPRKDSKITKEVFNEMKYVKAAIKEGMRMKPSTAAIQRMSPKDFVMNGYQIPEGTIMITCHSVMCQRDRYFKRPTEFLPERWLKSESDPEMCALKTNPFAALPFGFGRRSCVGKRFAELEMVVVLSKLFRLFEISYHHEPMTWSTKLLTYPSKPLKFKMTDRPE